MVHTTFYMQTNHKVEQNLTVKLYIGANCNKWISQQIRFKEATIHSIKAKKMLQIHNKSSSA